MAALDTPVPLLVAALMVVVVQVLHLLLLLLLLGAPAQGTTLHKLLLLPKVAATATATTPRTVAGATTIATARGRLCGRHAAPSGQSQARAAPRAAASRAAREGPRPAQREAVKAAPGAGKAEERVARAEAPLEALESQWQSEAAGASPQNHPAATPVPRQQAAPMLSTRPPRRVQEATRNADALFQTPTHHCCLQSAGFSTCVGSLGGAAPPEAEALASDAAGGTLDLKASAKA